MLRNRQQKNKRRNFTVRILSIILLSSFFIGFAVGCKTAKLTIGPESTPIPPTATTVTINPSNYNYDKYEHLFTVPMETTKLDILFVVDNSPSMSEDQARLGPGFNSFIYRIQASQIDYQVGFITTDMSGDGPTQNGNLLPIGRNANNGYILRSGDTDQGKKFWRTIERPETGSGDERGIYAAITALDRNQGGFIRADADLAIVIISDEDSRGEGGTHGRPLINGQDYGSDLVETALRIKGNKKVTISAIIVNPDDPYGEDGRDCLAQQRDQGDDATPHYGMQYYAAADATHGIIANICATSYNYHLEQMSYRLINTINSIDLNSLNLRCTPDQTGGRRTTIKDLPENRYSVNGQSITFDPPLMQPDQVTIEYWCSRN